MNQSTDNGAKKRRGRRRRRKFTNPIAVRLTPQAEMAIGMCARLLGMSVSGLIRAGVQSRLSIAAVAAHRMLEEQDMPEYRRERLVRFLDAARKAALSIHGPRWMLRTMEEVEHEARRIFWGLGRTRTATRPDRKFARCVQQLEEQGRPLPNSPCGGSGRLVTSDLRATNPPMN